jgi:hypothetical protein
VANVERDEAREERIMMEAIVDAYGAEEQAMGWYYYLEDRLAFPFQAQCISERRSSPLKQGEKVEVIGMAPEDDCMHEMFVEIRWKKRELAVPLAQLEALEDDERTQEGIGDWHYWVARGYELG